MNAAITLRVALAGALCTLPAGALAQEPDPQREALMREMQARVREATALGEHHEALRYFLGEWDVELAMVMPGVPAQRSAGVARFEWLVPGRWMAQRLEGEFMGMPYQQFSILGFDTYAKNHVVASVTSLDNALNVARGVVVDPEGRTTALYGTLDEYTTDELAKPYKVVTRVVGDDRFVMETWDLGIGPEGAKVLEFSYTRRR